MAVATNKRRRRRSSTKRRRRNTAVASNRAVNRPRHRFHRRRRSNPRFLNVIKDTVIGGAYAIGGGVVTRSLPQALMGEQNAGILGYLANIVTAVGGGSLVARFAGPQAGSMFTIGGSVMIVGRLFNDFLGRELVSFEQVTIPGVPQILGSDKSFDFRRRGLRGQYLPPRRLSGEMMYPNRQLPAMAGENPAWANTW